jgi:outer membrane protein assembly factor BamB
MVAAERDLPEAWRILHKMRKMRTVFVGISLLALAGAASAQFDGPAPVAWRWSQSTTVPPSGAPVVSGDTIYTAVGNRVYALDHETGNKLWQFPAVDPIDGLFRTAPVIVQGLLIAAADNKQIYAIDPFTGAQKWAYLSPGSIMGQPVAVGPNLVYAQTDNKIVVLDAATGTPVGDPYNVYSGVVGTMGAFGTDVLYFDGRNELVSLSTESKRPTWVLPLDQVPPDAVPVTYGDTIYLTSGPYVVAVNGATGKAKWEVSTQAQLRYGPAVSPDGVLVVSQDGKAYVYNADHRLISKTPIDLESFPVAPPAVAGRKFVVSTSNGAVNLIDPTQLTPIWSYLIRPLPEERAASEAAAASGSNRGGLGGPGGPGGGPGGKGGGGGGGQGGFGQGRQGGGRGGPGGGLNRPKKPIVIATVPASGAAVLDGQTLLVPVKDGSIIAFDKDLGVDLTPPSVKMLFPNPGDQVSPLSPLALLFEIADEASGVNPKTLTVTIDGKPYDYKYTPDGRVQIDFSQEGKNKLLTDGRKTIEIDVSDWMGNQAKVKFALVVDSTLRPVVLPGSDNNNNGLGGPGGKGGGFGGPGGGGFGGPGSGDGR